MLLRSYILLRAMPLNSRLFSNICKDTDSNYTTLLLNAEVRWLSRGQSLKRLLLLKDEIEISLTERKCEFAAFFSKWLAAIEAVLFVKYFCDLNFKKIGKNCDIFTSNDKVERFIKKISIWKSRVEKNSFEIFSSVDNFVIEKIHCKTCIAKTIVDHLKALEIQFWTYFILNIDLHKIVWIQKPFWICLSEIDHLPLKAQEEFAKLSCD